MKKFNCIVKFVAVTVVAVFFTFVLCGCQLFTKIKRKLDGYNDKPLTIEEIEQKTWEKYFNEDGTAKWSAWSYYFNEDGTPIRLTWRRYNEPMADRLDEITGFEVSIIKDVKTKEPVWYLIEFESVGFIYGELYRDYGKPTRVTLHAVPSPFKILGIEPDNRYCDESFCATIRDGVMTEINIEAYVDCGLIEKPSNWYPGEQYYDYETNTWINRR